MTRVAPVRDREQQFAALKRANEIRISRSRLKRELTVELALTVLADPPEHTRSMKTVDLLQAIPKWGAGRARRALLACRVSQSKTLSGLSGRQRDELRSFIAAHPRGAL